MNTIKVMVVDDSAVVRQVLQEMLNKDPAIEVIGAAADPIFAMNRMNKQWPDVIVLDVEMPRMDGITFLKKLMSERPTPVVICSTLTEKGAETTMQAMSAGAVSIITKPKVGLKSFLSDAADNIINAVKGAARANMANMRTSALKVEKKLSADAIIPGNARAMTKTTDKVIAIGTSTGGTQALEAVLTALPPTIPGIVIVQHMPEKFTRSFAERIDSLSDISVKEAENNDRVMPGRALIAPGGKHMLLKRNGAQYYVEVMNGPLVNRHRPSVDVLFRSVARYAGKNAVGFILTGMGDDGARGLLEMKNAGAETFAQDEKSCVVFGMPKEAIALNAASRVVSLDAVPAEIMRYSHD
ncbi:protein-glutamate methylesterase/protein-glutamine glutaminase [Gynuella sunshinyii]|uniref:Protein-glutamate methylesterase/protein-glutamine glutaminase n=1 Tax=Gynuella sunshinyii YC6258 TaxID=1445510 RepID=A0A0C5VSB9_9GAMM|nr:chemotaxis response regulator protein-glutamate methylesterase [Gynuella sunshinyii]AJQ97116.1 chemotaxis response regulator containing a CheY-like receiver domain and a methylesterase domain [Gynuella sunshinyii YC6258]